MLNYLPTLSQTIFIIHTSFSAISVTSSSSLNTLMSKSSEPTRSWKDVMYGEFIKALFYNQNKYILSLLSENEKYNASPHSYHLQWSHKAQVIAHYLQWPFKKNKGISNIGNINYILKTERKMILLSRTGHFPQSQNLAEHNFLQWWRGGTGYVLVFPEQWHWPHQSPVI